MRRILRKQRTRFLLLDIVALLIAIIFLLPLSWNIGGTFKTDPQIWTPVPAFFPTEA